MVRKLSSLAVLLCALFGFSSTLGLAQATADFSFAPQQPGMCAMVTFTATVTSGDRDWYIRYEWDFNQDGIYDATGMVVTHSFGAPAGTYPVTLRLTTPRQSFDYIAKNVITQNIAPVACFAQEPAIPSAGQVVEFDASCSTDPDCQSIVAYAWDLDQDGNYDDETGISPRYAFPTAGTHVVSLRVTDNGGATGTASRTVGVLTVPPVCAFTYSPAQPTVNDEIAFTDLSHDPDGGGIVSWQWSFGDGAMSSSRNPKHQYTSGGTFTVSLLVIDNDSETSTSTQEVTVAGPTAAFTYTPTSPTTQDPVQFLDQSHDPAGQMRSWSWNIGDGTSAGSVQNPIHTFSRRGIYRVHLTVTGDSGTVSAFRDIQVRNAPPLAAFTFSPALPKVGQMVTFGAGGSSDPDGTISLVEWDFDNDGQTDATGSTVTWSFTSVGAKPVTLKVTDDAGDPSYATKVVPVTATPPVADFTYAPTSPLTGETVVFDASASKDPDGTIILYEWDLNKDGKTDATGMTISHAFPTAGAYPVTLVVTDNDGAIAAVTKAIPVQVGGTGGDNRPPVADFKFTPAEPQVRDVVSFKATGSSDPDGQIVLYEWDFDGDRVYDATGPEVAHAYDTGGAKIVTLRITDDDGALGYRSQVVPVIFQRPTADFTYTPSQPRKGALVTFDASSSRVLTGSGRIDFYEWDFNRDGRPEATGKTVNYVFDVGGAVPVTLKVTDDKGGTDVVTKTVTVTINQPPIATFTFSPPNPTTADTITFTDASTDVGGSVVTWLWEFGDGATSTVQTPTHKYATGGTKAVKLTVTDNDGATATVTKSLVVTVVQNVAPVANFSFTPLVPQVNQEVQFGDLSTDSDGTVTGWAWSFGDGGASTAKNPTHAYSAAGTYSVALTVTDNGGATSAVVTNRVTVGQGGGEIATHSYPNPAKTQATLVFYVPEGATELVVRIYDVVGRLVHEANLPAGDSTYVWDLRSGDGGDLPTGLYFYVIAGKDATGKVIKSPIFKLLIVR